MPVRVDHKDDQWKKMFIGGLTYSTTDEMLKEFYSQWGDVVDCIVMKDPATKRSRGFGFVTFAEGSSVDDAMSNRPHTIDGKAIEPKRAIPRDMSGKSETNISVKRLYVSGVREDHTDEMFREHFGNYGNVLEVDIISDKGSGKKRGFAFITFDDYDAVDKCVLQKSHMIDGKRCDVKKALSKDEIKKAEMQTRERMERDMRSRGNMRGAGDYGGTGGGGGGGGGQYGGGDSWGQQGGGGPWGMSGGGGSSGGAWSGGNWAPAAAGGGYGDSYPPQAYGGSSGYGGGGNYGVSGWGAGSSGGMAPQGGAWGGQGGGMGASSGGWGQNQAWQSQGGGGWGGQGAMGGGGWGGRR